MQSRTDTQLPITQSGAINTLVDASPARRVLTIICPVHNEAKVIPLFYARMRPVMDELSKDYTVNLVFSNNASSDATLEVIESIRKEAKDVFVVSLAANVGYQRSLECSLRNCKGDLFAFIDADCEDPPEMILEFVRAHEQGFDIVYGERTDREESEYIKFLRKVFYRILRAMADDDVILDMAEFSLMTGEVRDAVIKDNTSYPFIRASISRVGFKRKGISYKRHARIAGKTHYNFIRLMEFALAGILSSSTLLLRVPIFVLPAWLLLMLVLPSAYLLTENKWFLVATFFAFATYVGATVSFIALYVARVLKNTLGRPNFVIDKKNSSLQP
jgi:dolichol-phosphate mannosyltransferase